MHVSKSLCKPTACNYECLDACTRVHGEDPPLGFVKDFLSPVIDEDTCTECLACVRVCPLDAISLDGSTQKKIEARNHPKASKSTEKPYEVSEDLSRMSEADTIFARVQFDPE